MDIFRNPDEVIQEVEQEEKRREDHTDIRDDPVVEDEDADLEDAEA
jgi:hypothetical protein